MLSWKILPKLTKPSPPSLWAHQSSTKRTKCSNHYLKPSWRARLISRQISMRTVSMLCNRHSSFHCRRRHFLCYPTSMKIMFPRWSNRLEKRRMMLPFSKSYSWLWRQQMGVLKVIRFLDRFKTSRILPKLILPVPTKKDSPFLQGTKTSKKRLNSRTFLNVCSKS